MILKWAMRYHRLEVEACDDEDEAFASAYYAADAGTEALIGFEGSDGEIPMARYVAWRERREQEELDELRDRRSDFYWAVEVERGGAWATTGWCRTEGEAKDLASKLTVLVGPKRVRLKLSST